MTATTFTTTPNTTSARVRAADLAAAATGFLVLLGLLHAVKPDLSPTWRTVSEYAIGSHGWLMSAAFLTLAASCVATIIAVKPYAADRAGRIGRVALGITAAELTLAGLATSDPITATPDQLTAEGNLHGLAAMIGMPAFLIAAVALHRSLRRHAAVSSHAVRRATMALVAAVVVFGASMAVMFDGAPSDPSVRIGIQNRILVVAYAAWLIVTARAARTART
jgi:Protein of unknown function (DUF998)